MHVRTKLCFHGVEGFWIISKFMMYKFLKFVWMCHEFMILKVFSLWAEQMVSIMCLLLRFKIGN